MRKQLFFAIAHRIKEQVPGIKFIDLWNEHMAEITQATAWPVPSVFVEFEQYNVKQCANFKPELTIADLRGKILVISRDTYDNGPHGAYINSWSHSDNYLDQTKAVISGPDGRTERALVQDFYDCTGIG